MENLKTAKIKNKVLIIDYEEDILSSCKNVLEEENYNVDKRKGTETDLALDELDNCFGDKDNVKEYADYSILKDFINDFLSHQSKQNRVIFVRRYFYMSSLEEISKEYNLNLSAVKMSLKRSRDNLRDYLIKKGYDL